MRAGLAITLAAGLAAVVALAGLWAVLRPDRAGAFDHYLLALTWTPTWCAATGDGRGDPRCAAGSGAGWLLHGLWPQHVTGWPEFCDTRHPDPSRALTEAQLDIMGSAGLALHQWRKHGSCSGLSPQDYFDTARAAFAAFPVHRAIAPTEAARLPLADLTDTLRTEWPQVPADGLVVICRGQQVHEVRICLTRDLAPRACNADVLARACSRADVALPALR